MRWFMLIVWIGSTLCTLWLVFLRDSGWAKNFKAKRATKPHLNADPAYLEAMAELDEITERTGLNFLFSFGGPVGDLPKRELIVGTITTETPVLENQGLDFNEDTGLYEYKRYSSCGRWLVKKVATGWDKGRQVRVLYVRHRYDVDYNRWLENVVEPAQETAIKELVPPPDVDPADLLLAPDNDEYMAFLKEQEEAKLAHAKLYENFYFNWAKEHYAS